MGGRLGGAMKPADKLSPTQLRILELFIREGGLRDKELCDKLAMPLGTLRTHWSRIHLKFGTSTRTEAGLCFNTLRPAATADSRNADTTARRHLRK